MAEITIERLPPNGATLSAVKNILPAGVQVSSVRQQHRNRLPDGDIVLGAGDGLLIAADRPASYR